MFQTNYGGGGWMHVRCRLHLKYNWGWTIEYHPYQKVTNFIFRNFQLTPVLLATLWGQANLNRNEQISGRFLGQRLAIAGGSPHSHVDLDSLLMAYSLSVAFSPRTNYTDWATATCRRNLVSTFADRGVSHGQRGRSPTAVNLSFLDRTINGIPLLIYVQSKQIFVIS
jgi:hypothetical protein